ncbi:hypothetical protein CEUSTIGMA_g9375.t1 [Chlamydomonas eustigma]|uniref:Glycosyl transferase CAP10 domain-containing protein n=1 Tax=Chlamydomonas eustigma TaxID=1157962 RepID=A0A250XFU9_9CHLO|nr:hypothetical protein CEUSTIGMA_g9375.t1 [Chlamydomonas eustigma]|eukprot:GAX81947.1 hypothetical protein CEUSTIGMA_g9375.t1 [Chlamydomonas eustigma]
MTAIPAFITFSAVILNLFCQVYSSDAWSTHAIDANFSRASEDADLESMYQANLGADLIHWKHTSQRIGRKFTLSDLVWQLQHTTWSPYLGVLIVKNGSVSRVVSSNILLFAQNRMSRMQRALIELQANGTSIPDTIMLINGEDVPICYRMHGCKAPIFTLFKRVSDKRGSSSSEQKLDCDHDRAESSVDCVGSYHQEEFEDTEILLPNFSQDWGHLHNFPWQDKYSAALLRGSLQHSMGVESSRYQLSLLSQGSSQASTLLDAGIVWNRNRQLKLPKNLMRNFVGMSNASRWRFLISTDGHTASSRLGHLLGVNSVVLKEKSLWVEYFYRSLKPGKEYLEFEVPSVLKLLDKITNPKRDSQMRSIALAGQHFSYRYLHARAKALYTRQAILQYNMLFEDMEEMVGRLPNLQQSGIKLRDLVGYLSDLTIGGM